MAHLALVGPFYPFRGGIAHFLVAMHHGLAARGHRVDAYTFTRQYPEVLFPGKTQLVDGPNVSGIDAVPVLDTIGPRSWLRTADRIADSGAEAVVFKYWMPFLAPSFGTMARRLKKRGVCVVAVVDNAIPHERRPGDHALSRYALKACDGLLVMSDQVRRDLGTLGIDKPVRQVRHPVYDVFGDAIPKTDARERLGLSADAPTFLFFGFIRRYKGLHTLLDAFPHVLERLPDARLVVAGEFYGDEADYRAQVERLGLANAVRFDADYIADENVGAYFCASDAVVQPYVTATQSGVAQIAFHFGRPVITTDVGGLAEAVPDGEAGLVVPPEDPEALAAAMVRYVEEGLEARFIEGVRRERATYSWDHVYDALETLISP
jgi:glycosyltransferase involved in cell wall biosynthesis